MKSDPLDPRGLIASAFEIDGISLVECRTIFLDWALSVQDADPVQCAHDLFGRYASHFPDHPMLNVLAEAGPPDGAPKRRRRRSPE